MKYSSVVKIGILISVSIVIFFWGMSFLKGKNAFKKADYYYIVYDRVDGLTESNPVLVNGYKIGQVDEIKFTEDYSGKLLVKIAIKDEFYLPKTTTARIYSSDLMGSKAVQLIFGKTKKLHQSGDTLKSEVERALMDEVNMQIAPIKTKAENLMLSFDSILTIVRSVFNEKTRENLKKSFTSIKNTIQNLERTTFTLDTFVTSEKSQLMNIFANVDSITANIKNNNEALTNVIENFSAISDSIAQSEIKSTIKNADATLANVNYVFEKINRGEGSLGMLVNNDTLYNNLENVSYNLNRLIRDLRENPKRYIHFSAFDLGKSVYVMVPDEKKALKLQERREKKEERREDRVEKRELKD